MNFIENLKASTQSSKKRVDFEITNLMRKIQEDKNSEMSKKAKLLMDSIPDKCNSAADKGYTTAIIMDLKPEHLDFSKNADLDKPSLESLLANEARQVFDYCESIELRPFIADKNKGLTALTQLCIKVRWD